MTDAYERAGRPAPAEIRLKQAERALEIDYADGMSFRFPAELLRVESPSAEVMGHSPSQRQWLGGKMQVGISRIEPVGTYAVRLGFDDGHDTGIFSWSYFYNLGRNQDAIWQTYLAAIAERGLSRE